MSRPIPKALLIHSATLTRKANETTNDMDVVQSYGPEEVLTRVRIEPSTRLIKTADNQEVQVSATLFFDKVNSLPTGTVFNVGDKVVLDGTRYEVSVVDTLIGDRSWHHYEVGLSVWRR